MSRSPASKSTERKFFSLWLPFAWIAWVSLVVGAVYLGVNTSLERLIPHSSDPALFVCSSAMLFIFLFLPVWFEKADGRRDMLAQAMASIILIAGPFIAAMFFVHRLSHSEMTNIWYVAVLVAVFTALVVVLYHAAGRWYLPVMCCLLFVLPLYEFIVGEIELGRTGKVPGAESYMPNAFAALSGLWSGDGNGGGWGVCVALYSVLIIMCIAIGVRRES
ncbi:MAG: hypothetical protein JXR97_11810 [Planctomycetes bacterium]|nr:hypothetical protein [Planctomycetota bacterium]